MTFSKEFKEAISYLPAAEKDKLILRLLRKDLVLANRLMFELVSTDTVEECRQNVEKEIIKEINRSTNFYYGIGYLIWDLRTFSGLISEHVNITKDRYGEAYLILVMLNEFLKTNKNQLLAATNLEKLRKICIAIIAKAFKALIIISKLHEDYLVEFEELLTVLGSRISENKFLKDVALKNGFNVNWLEDSNIPKEIEAIHKDLRAKGFMK